MDFLLALKGDQPALSLANLQQVLIVFALLGVREYVEMILLHMLLFEYHKQTQHPNVDVFTNLLQLLIGEDIELANRALSHASIRNSRRSELEQLAKCYRLLRYLRISGVQFGEDMMEYKDIVKGDRRYDVNQEETLEATLAFFNGVLDTFEQNTFNHYKIPYKIQKTSQRIRPPASKEERKQQRILVLRSSNVESLVKCTPERELIEVPYIGAYDWMFFIETCMEHLFNKRRDIASKLKVETLEYIQNKSRRYAAPSLGALITKRKAPVSLKRKRTGPRLFSG
jgi:hypothetical protein